MTEGSPTNPHASSRTSFRVLCVGSFHSWLELARISNLPTVLSNAIAGATIGSCAYAIEHASVRGIVHWFGGFESHPGPDGPVDPFSTPLGAVRFLTPLAIPMLAYVGGMILNDAFDAEIDARERPARPIPSGRVGRRIAFAVGFALLAASIALAFVTSTGVSVVIATALLAAAIVIYDRFHTKSIASTLLLALCRALASLIPMLAFARGEFTTLVTRGAILLPIALAAWTLGLSLLARNEIALRDDDAQFARDTEAPHPCPACGQLMVGGFASCGECGHRSSEPERRIIERERRALRHRWRALIPFGAVAALLTAFFLGKAALLHRDRDLGYTDVSANPGAAIIIAIFLAFTALRATRILRHEPARTPDAIGMLIACLALVDAMALATGGHWLAALVCAVLFGITRRWQRVIAGS
jgi:hypothetical protein